MKISVRPGGKIGANQQRTELPSQIRHITARRFFLRYLCSLSIVASGRVWEVNLGGVWGERETIVGELSIADNNGIGWSGETLCERGFHLNFAQCSRFDYGYF